MRQMVAPGIEAGIRITSACVRCRISRFSTPHRVGKMSTTNPSLLLCPVPSICWSGFFFRLFFLATILLWESISPPMPPSSLQAWVLPFLDVPELCSTPGFCHFFFSVEYLLFAFQGCPLLLLPTLFRHGLVHSLWASVMSCKMCRGACGSFLMQ